MGVLVGGDLRKGVSGGKREGVSQGKGLVGPELAGVGA